jgi:hypothetical protein
MGKHKLDRLFKHIEDLTSQQAQFEQYSAEWLSLEGQIVFTECMIFNKLLKAENIDINEYSAVLSLISLHLITYIEEDKFSIGICPEGTRNKKEGLLPFKSGCFKIASKAKCPLVICTITNADKVFKNFPFKKTTMEFHIVDVIEYEDLKDLSTHEIALLARRKMVENLNINETLEESKQMIE